jgi:hypothetical protein
MYNGKKVVTIAAKHIPIKLLMALIACALLVAFPFPAFAVTDTAQITVTVGPCLQVEYTGPDPIVFHVTKKELDEGSMQIHGGDLNWWANVAPWNIMIERTLWDTVDGDQNLELWLEAHYGPPPPPPPPPPDFIEVTTTAKIWIHGTETGSGTFVGVDWKIKKLNWGMQPGTYWCTVTISIVPG